MPNADDDQLGPELEERLRGELDRVQPRYSSPRYVAASRRPIIWRVAPAALVVGVLGILGLSGYVKTGSPNPVVWTERVVTVVHPNTASPAPGRSPGEHESGPATTPAHNPEHKASPAPTEKPESGQSPEPSGSPEAHESPESSNDHSGTGTGSGSSDSGSGSSADSSPTSATPSDDD